MSTVADDAAAAARGRRREPRPRAPRCRGAWLILVGVRAALPASG